MGDCDVCPAAVVAAARTGDRRGGRVDVSGQGRAPACGDRLGEWLSDEQFAGVYGKRGQPGGPPSRLALVTILQMVEDLTDRQAAEAVRTRIDWKCALGLALGDPSFDVSISSEFRGRVAASGLEQVVLETLLQRLAADGLVAAGQKMRTDSTHVISAVRDLNRLELAGESVRACLAALAVVAPQVVAQLLDDSWGKRYAAPADTSPQARAGAGFDRTAFTIDFDARQGTCLQGQTSSSWNPVTSAGPTRS